MARTKKLVSFFLVIMLIITLVPSYVTVSAASEEETKIDYVLSMLELNLGDIEYVTSDLQLIDTDDMYGTTITWSSSNTDYLWEDGTIIRPPSGKDATVVLTATVSLNDVSKSKDFSVGIPAYDANIRVIDTVHTDPDAPADEFYIDVPVGTCPKLPYRVWVNYSDGYGEWRQTQWPWSGIVGTGADRSGPVGSNTPPDQEEQWKAMPVGEEYTVTGWIIGDDATNLGYPITVNCKVVANAAETPNNNVEADVLPMSKVTLIGENRLTSNTRRAVTAIASWDPDQYLWNYRDTYGLEQPEGVTPFSRGWEAPNSKLRGHGAGHFINAMCLAYVSGQGTEAERQTIYDNLVYMIDELRSIQELTFVKIGEDGNGDPIYREGSNVWPYYAEDKAELASDWPFALLSEITSPVPITFIHGDEGDQPEWFGYGYLHATPPLHPVLNEAYRPYSEWIWAPYYSIHKQLAGFMDVYYTFKDDSATSETAETALMIARDMSRWISDRLTVKCRIEDTRDTTTYGNLNATWYANISGEYGGVNESIARCAYALDDSDPVKELLLRGSEMFDNKSYWDPLAENSEVMWNGTAGIGGNSHANQRIPQMPGVLWSYRGNGDSRFYNIAKNFFDFNAGRYRYYGGNVGVGEWYRAPYTQINTMTNTGNETCCATNLARLSKDLACFEPDNAEYMDYYERVMYNQLVGSLHQNSWSLTYQYALGPNTPKPTGNDNPGSTCCGGTGAENHVRYTDASYLVSDNAIWVNLYMPTQCVWDNAGVTLTQDCTWPAENSKITVKPNDGQEQKAFAMHLRVPWWATKDFDITLNGVSLIDLGYTDSFSPSSYVVIPERVWSETDTVEINMPFVESIDYGPDRKDGQWTGVIFYGPLAMAGTGDWSTLNINSDLSNIVKNGAEDLPNSNANTPGNNRTVYSMSVDGQSHSNADLLQPDYYTGLDSSRRTLYYTINMVSSGEGTNRTALYNSIRIAREVEEAGYTPGSFAALQATIDSAVIIYQNLDATQAEIDAHVIALQDAINNLVPTESSKASLLELINKAVEMKEAQEAWEALPNGNIDDKPCAPYGYARMLEKLAEAQAVYDNASATRLQINDAYTELENALNSVRKGYMPEIEDLAPLEELLEYAKSLRANSYSLDSYSALLEAIENGEEEVTIVTAGSSTINQDTIPNAINMLQDAIDGLVVDYAPDKENLWSNMNYTFFSEDSNFSLESEGNYFREGALIDLQEWSAIWHFQWWLIPDDNHEYFQFRRRSSYNATAATVLGPYTGKVEAGNVLVLVHGDETNDSQWWKPVLQEDGKYVIVNKADPSLCIAVQSGPAAAGGRVMLAPLDAPDSKWRILGSKNPSNSTLPQDPPTLALEKKVASVAPLADITVPVNTPINEITLPSRASVTFEGNSKAMRNIVWDTSKYNSSADGIYTLTGTVELDGIETNPNEIKATIDIKVGEVNSISINNGLIIIEPKSIPDETSSVFDPVFSVTAKKDMSINLIVAAYDENGVLADRDVQTFSLEADVLTDIQASIPRVEGYTYHFYIWDANFVPLTAITQFEKPIDNVTSVEFVDGIPETKTFGVGDVLVFDDIKVKITYSDGTFMNTYLLASDISNGANTETAGSKTAEFTFGNRSVSVAFNVVKHPLAALPSGNTYYGFLNTEHAVRVESYDPDELGQLGQWWAYGPDYESSCSYYLTPADDAGKYYHISNYDGRYLYGSNSSDSFLFSMTEPDENSPDYDFSLWQVMSVGNDSYVLINKGSGEYENRVINTPDTENGSILYSTTFDINNITAVQLFKIEKYSK